MIRLPEGSRRKLGVLLVLLGILAGAVYWGVSKDLSFVGGPALADESVVDLIEEDSVDPSPLVSENEPTESPEEEASEEEEVELRAIDPDGRLKKALAEIAETTAATGRSAKAGNRESENVGDESAASLTADLNPPGDEGGKLFKANTGLLFLYRQKWDGISSRNIPVFLNNRPLTKLEHGKFLAIPCTLDTHEVSSEMERQRVSVKVSHGETYCLNVYTGMLGKGGVRLMPLKECRKQIEGLAPQFASGPIPILFE